MSLRFRRHRKLVILLLLLSALLVLGFGDEPIVAYTMGNNAQVVDLSTSAQAGFVLLDGTFTDPIESLVSHTGYQ
ncbi:MAG: hypothetical protein JXA93_07075 [Anaerolineae bacterium]|nr:hypothetical protein [Anaerolineae bacterium]